MSTPVSTLPPVPDPATQDGEPLAFVGGLTALVAALLATLVAFGVPLNADQRVALAGLIAVAAPIVTTVIGRTKVFSPMSVAALLSAANPTYARTGTIAVTPPPPATPGPAAGPPLTT